MNAPFSQRLSNRIQSHGNSCLGIDPHTALLQQWGLEDSAKGLAQFSELCVSAFSSTAAVVKPQVAFYERHGSQGFAVLEDTIGALRQAGVLVIADAKRGDIGSTMAGYVDAWCHPNSPLYSDAVTVSPYLGVSSLDPTIATAAEHGCGVYVLARTSNPEATALQHAVVDEHTTVAQSVVDHLQQLPAHLSSETGVVVGATVKNPPRLGGYAGSVLLPGVGAQGATVSDVHELLQGDTQRALVNISRAVLQAGPNSKDLAEAARTACEELKLSAS